MARKTTKAEINKNKPGVLGKNNPDTGALPLGFNKNLRDTTRIILTVVAAFLFWSYSKIAFILSFISVINMHRGTAFSHKNWKWGVLSWYSMLSCMWSMVL